jgi:hypothetical protein
MCENLRTLDLSSANQYRTGSGPGSPAGQPGWGGGSDLVVYEMLNYAQLDFFERNEFLEHAIRPGRYRSRFCIEWRLV